MSSTTTLQNIVTSARAYPELVPVLGESGFTQEPALTFGNIVMQSFLAQTLDWKFNRAYVPAFLTVGLQQDYVTNVTNLSWLEQGWRIDINNSTNNGNQGPKPIFTLETVRDLALTAYQGYPFNCSWLPNSLAQMGVWTANTVIPCAYGQAQTPTSPIQQFIDKNGNILFINSASLGLSVNSPGFNNAVIPENPPYGTTGSTAPFLGTNAAAGSTIVDGTVTWTVADPNGVCIRLAPLPALNGLAWLITPVYQMKPPILKSLQNTISPIPDELGYMFREGFLALCFEHANSKQFAGKFMQWRDSLTTALRSGDREREDAVFFPSQGLMGGGGPWVGGLPVGAAWPFETFGTQ